MTEKGIASPIINGAFRFLKKANRIIIANIAPEISEVITLLIARSIYSPSS